MDRPREVARGCSGAAPAAGQVNDLERRRWLAHPVVPPGPILLERAPA